VPDAPSKQEAVTEVSLLALEDSTIVTVNATHELFNGTQANAPYTVLLNKGDIHNILAKDGGNLAGTSIQSIQSDNDSKSFACYAAQHRNRMTLDCCLSTSCLPLATHL
jgi:hypothetical protein